MDWENSLINCRSRSQLKHSLTTTAPWGYSFSHRHGSAHERIFQPHSLVKPEDILTAAGLTAMHEMMGLALGNPGDGVLFLDQYMGDSNLTLAILLD
jgi:hypothetical protein